MTTIAEIELLAEATEALPPEYDNDGTDLTLVAHGTAVLCANWGLPPMLYRAIEECWKVVQPT